MKILARYPGVVGRRNTGPRHDQWPRLQRACWQLMRLSRQATLQRLGTTPLSQISGAGRLAQALFRGFDVDPTQYRSASESLLRRLTKKKGDIPSINLLVDLGKPGQHSLCAARGRVRYKGITGSGFRSFCQWIGALYNVGPERKWIILSRARWYFRMKTGPGDCPSLVLAAERSKRSSGRYD